MAEILDLHSKRMAETLKRQAYVVDLLAACLEKMRLAGLKDKEIVGFLRRVAAELDDPRE
jgi:hypothetical protein